MGGKVFSNLERISRSKIISLTENIVSILNEHGIKNYPVKFVDSKESFGDLDILVFLTDIEKLKDLSALFDPLESNLNYDTLSMNIDNHQVDLIFAQEKNENLLSTFYNYSIYGYAIDRMLRDFNLKITTNGLSYIYNGIDTKRAYFHITDEDRTFELLKLDKLTYDKGFKNYEEVFEYLSTSPYFRNVIYLPESMTNASRTRAKKREVYHMLLDWLSDKTFELRDTPKLPDDLQLIVDELCKKHDDVIKHHLELKEKFNGHIVNELTGITGKNLSIFMANIKAKYTHEELCSNAKNIILNEFKDL